MSTTLKDNTPDELDNILVSFFNEAEKDVHSDNFNNGTVFTKAGTNAKQKLRDYIAREIATVIGADDTPVMQEDDVMDVEFCATCGLIDTKEYDTFECDCEKLNQLRAGQRKTSMDRGWRIG